MTGSEWFALIAILPAVLGLMAATLALRTSRRDLDRMDESSNRLRAAEAELLQVIVKDGHSHTPRVRPERSSGERTASANPQAAALWRATNARLNAYHDAAQAQGNSAFFWARIASIVGFCIMLLASVAVVLVPMTTTATVVSGSLGAFSFATASYVGRTFLRTYETATARLSTYFSQPVDFARYLHAERMINAADVSETERAQLLSELIRSMTSSAAPEGAPE